MIQLFSKENIKDTLIKKPLALYFCPPGACGPEGLFFVLFNDKTIYGYLVNHKNTDYQFIKTIIEHIPELHLLLNVVDDYQFKRERYINDYQPIYLGLGNEGLLENSFYSTRNTMNGQYSYPYFLSQISEYSGENIKNMYALIKEKFDG